ncbi:hypothetical protein [Achromobacter kerstersii]
MEQGAENLGKHPGTSTSTGTGTSTSTGTGTGTGTGTSTSTGTGIGIGTGTSTSTSTSTSTGTGIGIGIGIPQPARQSPSVQQGPPKKPIRSAGTPPSQKRPRRAAVFGDPARSSRSLRPWPKRQAPRSPQRRWLSTDAAGCPVGGAGAAVR